MRTTCTFVTPGQPACPEGASYRVVKGWQERLWCVEDWASLHAESQPSAWQGQAEFCTVHAEAVCAQRNAPPPLADLLPRPQRKAVEQWQCAVCREPLGVAAYDTPKVGKICGDCQRAYLQVDELAPVPAARGRRRKGATP